MRVIKNRDFELVDVPTNDHFEPQDLESHKP